MSEYEACRCCGEPVQEKDICSDCQEMIDDPNNWILENTTETKGEALCQNK